MLYICGYVHMVRRDGYSTFLSLTYFDISSHVSIGGPSSSFLLMRVTFSNSNSWSLWNFIGTFISLTCWLNTFEPVWSKTFAFYVACIHNMHMHVMLACTMYYVTKATLITSISAMQTMKILWSTKWNFIQKFKIIWETM